MSIFSKLHPLNMCHLLDVSYDSVSLLKIYWEKTYTTVMDIKEHNVIELKVRYYTSESLSMLKVTFSLTQGIFFMDIYVSEM